MIREVSTLIRIKATHTEVWAALTDFRSYSLWNPFIRSVEGELKLGSLLQFTVDRGADKLDKPQARILTLESERELAWGGSAPMGLFRGRHSFKLCPKDDSVELENREVFSGLLAPLLINKRRLVAQQRAFDMQNQALKHWLESPRSS
ncbi:MAG: SRPBCC family protein [Pseudomonadales bacterium]